jgi:hypothetical protein
MWFYFVVALFSFVIYMEMLRKDRGEDVLNEFEKRFPLKEAAARYKFYKTTRNSFLFLSILCTIIVLFMLISNN